MIKYRLNPVKDYLAGPARTIFVPLFADMAQPLQNIIEENYSFVKIHYGKAHGPPSGKETV
jgi:hypothetical protein